MREVSLFSSLDISASGLSAQRLKMNVIANNIANASTTRTAEGGPYRRQTVEFKAAQDGPQVLIPVPEGGEGATGARRGGELHRQLVSRERMAVLPAGVEVSGVSEDTADFPTVYDPSHPDADASGYVKMPNVNPVTEMMDLMGASRAYEANISAIVTAREMAQKTLEMGK